LFQFISFRAALAIILSLGITLAFGNRIISSLKKLQVGESVRDLGLEGQKEKDGTPTMGGVMTDDGCGKSQLGSREARCFDDTAD